MYVLRYNLQFFAQEGSGGEKTEDATAKKLKDARDDGQVAKSQDLVMATTLVGLFLILKYFVGYIGDGFMKNFISTYSKIADTTVDGFTQNTARLFMNEGLKQVLMIGVPIFIFAFTVIIVVSISQVKWNPTLKPLKPKFSKFNPISGFKRMISLDKVVELIKSVAKILVICYVIYDAMKEKWGMLLQLYGYSLPQALTVTGNLIIDLGLKMSLCILAIALIDLIYQKRKFKKDMKMTKQEVKDEYKNSEGNPEIKGKIRQKMREVSQKRMMQSLPEADVVITNPTHLAVAVKYDKEASEAPIVIAKGADYLAEKIKGIAKENHIEIVENKPLARMLYYNVELEQEIPPELYQMVAEVLAYVYGLKGKV